MRKMKYITGIALSLFALPALAQQQPAAPPQSKADAALNAAWQQMVGAAETAAISGPDQLRAAKAAQDALRAWMVEQQQKLADTEKDHQAKLEAVQKDRQTLAAQIASLNKQLAEAKKPDPADKARTDRLIAHLAAELAQARRECIRINPSAPAVPSGGLRSPNAPAPSDLPHSNPAPGRK